jgi:hypothetical protein
MLLSSSSSSSFLPLYPLQNPNHPDSVVVKENDRQQIALREKLTRMIHTFWDINIKSDNNKNEPMEISMWKTLPHRIHTLRHDMMDLVECIQQQQVQQHGTATTTTRLSFVDLSNLVTASILVHQQQQSKQTKSITTSTNVFQDMFENYFVASLLYHIITTVTNNNNNNPNEDTITTTLSLLEQQEQDYTVLQDLFGPNTNDNVINMFRHLRQLQWIQQSVLPLDEDLVNQPQSQKQQSTVNHTSTSTTTNMTSVSSSSSNQTFILHEPLLAAVQKVLTKHIRTTIVGNYDDPNDDTDDDTTAAATTTSYQSILDWVNRNILPWICNTVFGMEQLPSMDHNENAIIAALQEASQQQQQQLRQEIQERVHYMVLQTYWKLRLKELFDIVTSYPDSLPAILELKSVFTLLVQKRTQKPTSLSSSVVRTTDMVRNCEHHIHELAQSLRTSFMVRLNHPGATTTQMIDVYIAAIQVIRILFHDTAMVSSNHIHTLISYTTEPVRSYLRTHRTDTVRCILTSLTNTGNSTSSNSNSNSGTSTSTGTVHHSSNSNHVLYQELRRQDTKPLEYMTMNSDDEDDDEEECPTMSWQPRPSIYSYTHQQQQVQRNNSRTGSGSSSSTRNDSDILSMLVSIYGSKELFVNEYRTMLADKLLGSRYEYNTDQDVHTLELLKLRFGEMSLINAEVMIKDIEDSARINKNIHDSYVNQRAAKLHSNNRRISSTSSSDLVVDAAIVSHVFWPKLQQNALKHHPRIQVMLDEYATIYAEQKNPRLLQWYNHLGSIQLELVVVEERINDSTRTVQKAEATKEFNCSPLLATLISHFEDETTWTADQLSNETNVPDHIIVKHMSYWISQRVVTCSATDSTFGTSSTYDTTKIVYTLSSRDSMTR